MTGSIDQRSINPSHEGDFPLARIGGDVNGDKVPDITTSYSFAVGATRVYTFYGTGGGGVSSPVPTWYARAGAS
ncbi:hypothetical protein ABZ990_20980 [Streptomyces sp. NPDC046203]|uniref:hypothetical protein n=1 Tax=Streptomyces sp. NPDC046203 TaxID=3154602 RepID=UPI0033E0AF5D